MHCFQTSVFSLTFPVKFADEVVRYSVCSILIDIINIVLRFHIVNIFSFNSLSYGIVFSVIKEYSAAGITRINLNSDTFNRCFYHRFSANRTNSLSAFIYRSEITGVNNIANFRYIALFLSNCLHFLTVKEYSAAAVSTYINTNPDRGDKYFFHGLSAGRTGNCFISISHFYSF